MTPSKAVRKPLAWPLKANEAQVPGQRGPPPPFVVITQPQKVCECVLYLSTDFLCEKLTVSQKSTKYLVC